MALVILSFVNLSRQDAFLSVGEANGEQQYVIRLAPGQATRQSAAAGQTWSVVASDTFQIPAPDKNRVYLISASGIYRVETTTSLASESGVSMDDPDFRGEIGGGAPAF